MSIQMMTTVYQSGLDKSQKAVALAYADHADDTGSNIFPSVDYIAWKTGYTDRSVQRITKQLLTNRVLIPDGVGPHGTNKYQLLADNLPKRPPFIPKKKNPYMGGDKMSPPTSTTQKMSSMSPDPSVNHYIEKGSGFNWMEIPVNVGLEIDGGIVLDNVQTQEMVSEIAGTVKEIHNPWKEDDPILQTAYMLLMLGRTPEQVHSFRAWWKVNGHYPGKPAVKSLQDELENCINGVEKCPQSRPDSEITLAWTETLEWRGKQRKPTEFTSAITKLVIGRIGESTFRNMGKNNEPKVKQQFRETFESIRRERNVQQEPVR